MDRACPTTRPSVNNENIPALDSRRQEKDQKHHEEGQCRVSLKPLSRPGDHQRRWPRIGRDGGSLLLHYALQSVKDNNDDNLSQVTVVY